MSGQANHNVVMAKLAFCSSFLMPSFVATYCSYRWFLRPYKCKFRNRILVHVNRNYRPSDNAYCSSSVVYENQNIQNFKATRLHALSFTISHPHRIGQFILHHRLTFSRFLQQGQRHTKPFPVIPRSSRGLFLFPQLEKRSF